MPSFDWNLDGSGFGQQTAESCWYAAYAILWSWKQRPLASIRERIEKAGLDFDDYYNNGLPVEDFPKTRSALGLVGWGGGNAFALAGDLDDMAHRIKVYGPLWCAVSRPSAHVVVLVGADPDGGLIHILNPWSYNGLDAESQYLTAPQYRQKVNAKAPYSVLQAFM